MPTAGPEASGFACGVPVPRMTTCVFVAAVAADPSVWALMHNSGSAIANATADSQIPVRIRLPPSVWLGLYHLQVLACGALWVRPCATRSALKPDCLHAFAAVR